jgi:hypothetical protein
LSESGAEPKLVEVNEFVYNFLKTQGHSGAAKHFLKSANVDKKVIASKKIPDLAEVYFNSK